MHAGLGAGFDWRAAWRLHDDRWLTPGVLDTRRSGKPLAERTACATRAGNLSSSRACKCMALSTFIVVSHLSTPAGSVPTQRRTAAQQRSCHLIWHKACSRSKISWGAWRAACAHSSGPEGRAKWDGPRAVPGRAARGARLVKAHAVQRLPRAGLPEGQALRVCEAALRAGAAEALAGSRLDQHACRGVRTGGVRMRAPSAPCPSASAHTALLLPHRACLGIILLQDCSPAQTHGASREPRARQATRSSESHPRQMTRPSKPLVQSAGAPGARTTQSRSTAPTRPKM